MISVLITKAVPAQNFAGIGVGFKREPHCTGLFPDGTPAEKIAEAVSALPIKDGQYQILPTETFVFAQQTILVPESMKSLIK